MRLSCDGTYQSPCVFVQIPVHRAVRNLRKLKQTGNANVFIQSCTPYVYRCRFAGYCKRFAYANALIDFHRRVLHFPWPLCSYFSHRNNLHFVTHSYSLCQPDMLVCDGDGSGGGGGVVCVFVCVCVCVCVWSNYKEVRERAVHACENLLMHLRMQSVCSNRQNCNGRNKEYMIV